MTLNNAFKTVLTDIAYSSPVFQTQDLDYPEFKPVTHRGFCIERDRSNFQLWHVAKSETGDIPVSLTGKYTKVEFVTAAIDKYLDYNETDDKSSTPN